MVAYSFQARFREPILAGTKRQTIRADRKRHARPYEEMQLYTGMRTRRCALIERVICIKVIDVSIDLKRGRISSVGDRLSLRKPDDLHEFAVSDGFRDWEDLKDFWVLSHPGIALFTGWVIAWSRFDDPYLRS